MEPTPGRVAGSPPLSGIPVWTKRARRPALANQPSHEIDTRECNCSAMCNGTHGERMVSESTVKCESKQLKRLATPGTIIRDPPR